MAEAIVVLRTMFGANIPAPIDIAVPDWIQNQLFQGMFVDWPAGFVFYEV